MPPLNWQDAGSLGPRSSAQQSEVGSPTPPTSTTSKTSTTSTNPLAVSLSNPWFAVSLGLLGLIVGYGLASFSGSTTRTGGGSPVPSVVQAPSAPLAPTPIQAPTPRPAGNPATVDDDAVLGKKDAPVTLIEFVDYQCPFCGRFATQTLPQLKKEYVDTGKVKLVMRDFPLSFHQNAPKASEATECAEEGGKFWEMHDLIFEKQGEWAQAPNASELFKQYAASLGLPKTFDACLDTGKYAQEVQKDFADGSTSGVSGTPNFWVLGPGGKSEQISGAVPFSNFQSVIDRLLGSAGPAAAAPPAG